MGGDKKPFKGIEDSKGQGFDNNPQNINLKGRPKKIYTILKEKGFSKGDIQTAFGELAFYQKKELVELRDDWSKPIIARIVAKQFLLAYKQGNWTLIREIIEHSIGRPMQPTKIDLSKDVEIDFTD